MKQMHKVTKSFPKHSSLSEEIISDLLSWTLLLDPSKNAWLLDLFYLLAWSWVRHRSWILVFFIFWVAIWQRFAWLALGHFDFLLWYNALFGLNFVFSIFWLLFFQAAVLENFVRIWAIHHHIFFLFNFYHVLIQRNVQKDLDLPDFFNVMGIFQQDLFDSVNNSITVVLKNVWIDWVFSRVFLWRHPKHADGLTSWQLADTPAFVRSWLIKLRYFVWLLNNWISSDEI